MNTLDNIADKTTRPRVQTLHPWCRQQAIDAIVLTQERLSGLNIPRSSYAMRTFDQQHGFFVKGRKLVNGIWVKVGTTVTNADAGQSYHNYGLAIDEVLVHPDGVVKYSLKEDMDNDGIADWLEMAQAFKELGWSWGGEFNSIKDNPHFEMIPLSIQLEAQKRNVRPWFVMRERVNKGQTKDGFILFDEWVVS